DLVAAAQVELRVGLVVAELVLRGAFATVARTAVLATQVQRQPVDRLPVQGGVDQVARGVRQRLARRVAALLFAVGMRVVEAQLPGRRQRDPHRELRAPGDRLVDVHALPQGRGAREEARIEAVDAAEVGRRILLRAQ